MKTCSVCKPLVKTSANYLKSETARRIEMRKVLQHLEHIEGAFGENESAQYHPLNLLTCQPFQYSHSILDCRIECQY